MAAVAGAATFINNKKTMSMRPRIKTLKQTFCSSSFGAKGVRSLVEEGIKKHVPTIEEHKQQLKEELQKTISRSKYAIKERNGEKVIYIMTAKGNFGSGILC